MADYQEFIQYFPEFEDPNEKDKINRIIDHVVLANNGYNGVPSDGRRKLAIYLRTAHHLTIDSRISQNQWGPIEEMETREDKAKFAIASNQKGFSLSSTIYGLQLKNLLRQVLPVGGIF